MRINGVIPSTAQLPKVTIIKSDKIDFENKVPTLIQKKYINIPTNDKEVSLMQEHVIGSFIYTLSKKRLNKQMNFKLVFN